MTGLLRLSARLGLQVELAGRTYRLRVDVDRMRIAAAHQFLAILGLLALPTDIDHRQPVLRQPQVVTAGAHAARRIECRLLEFLLELPGGGARGRLGHGRGEVQHHVRIAGMRSVRVHRRIEDVLEDGRELRLVGLRPCMPARLQARERGVAALAAGLPGMRRRRRMGRVRSRRGRGRPGGDGGGGQVESAHGGAARIEKQNDDVFECEPNGERLSPTNRKRKTGMRICPNP